ncbi:MAG: PHP domain-containing protein [Prolixibacteraceae bacterium]|nr:PHP domain-containing protein [Prolixibacteraceae bacterium]
MKQYRGDLHIHTTLSPCGSLEMTPLSIILRAKELGWDFIAITDHNDTRQAPIIKELGQEHHITVFMGAEICSKEEVHLLSIVGTESARLRLQNYLTENRIKVTNNPEYFGDQVVVNKKEEIVIEEKDLLLTALNKDVYDICNYIHQIGGLVIASHINRLSYSILSTMGSIPDDLPIDAVEISDPQFPPLGQYCMIHNNDAHYMEDLKENHSLYSMKDLSFYSLKECILNHQIQII